MGELINGRTPEEIKAALELCNMISNRKNICESCPYNGECTPEGKPDQPGWDALVYIQRLESERDEVLAKVPKWISVEERLPEKRGTYLCNYKFDESGRIAMSCDYLGDKGWSFMTANVTHWMPLPDPPKGGE